MEGKDELPAEGKSSRERETSKGRDVYDLDRRRRVSYRDDVASSRPRAEKVRARPQRTPHGFADIGGGWLVPRLDGDADDVAAWELRATFATILTLAARAGSNMVPAEDAERDQLLQQALWRARGLVPRPRR